MPRPRLRRATAVVFLLGLLATGGPAACQGDTRITHPDRDGPLSSNSSSATLSIDQPPHLVGGTWQASFGMFLLCVHDPAVPEIELERVTVESSEDTTPVRVTVLLRHARFAGTEFSAPFYSLVGDPTGQADGEFSDAIAGTRIGQSCDAVAPDRDLADFTELVFVVTADTRGAHITRAEIDYRAAGERYRLTLGRELIACGTAITSREDDPHCRS